MGRPQRFAIRSSLVILTALALAACRGPDRSAPEHFAKAQRFFDARALVPAGDEIDAALKADPRNREARFLAGRIAAATGDTRAAYVEYTRAGLLDPGGRGPRIAVIELLLDAGEADAALSRINASLGDDPRNADALALRALLEQQRGDAAKARRDAQAVLVTAPRQPVAHAVLAALALADGATPEARAELERGLAADPDNRWLLQLAATMALRDGDRPRAVALYRQAIAAHPEFPRLRVACAEIESGEGNGGAAAAEATLRAAVAVAPRSMAIRLALASFLRQHGQDDAATEVLRQAIRAFPDEGTADMALAADLARGGRAAAARTTLQDAIDRLADGPARQGVRLALARLTIEDGDLRAARTMLDAMIRATPEDDAALLLRAEILAPAEADRAVADLLAVSARRPGDPQVYDLLATAYRRAGKPDEALAAERRVVDLRPDDIAAAGRFVDLALASGKPGEARSLLEGLVARSPASLPARAAAIRFSISQKDWRAAEAGLTGLEALPGSADVALDLAGTMKLAQGKPGEAADLYGAAIDTAAPATQSVWARAYARAAVAAGRAPDALARLQSLRGTLGPAAAAPISLVVASLQMALKQGPEAVASDDATIRAAPTSVAGYLQKASDLTALGQPVPAVAALDQGLAAGAPPVPLLLAKAALLLGRSATDAAIDAYKAVLATAPGDVIAANNLVSLLADRKPVDRAELTAARDVLRPYAASAEPHLLDSLAWADYRLGEADAARDLLARAEAGTAPSPDLRFHYGAVLIATGDKARGQALIRSVLDQPFTGKSEAQALLTN